MNEAGGGEPKQQFEVTQVPQSGEQSDVALPEQQRPAAQESAAGKQAVPAALQPLPVIPDLPAAAPVALPKTDDTQQPVVSPQTSKLKAADGEKIEKEWVNKAKAIVAQTKSDPYKQKNEMSKVKADYIGKRYNKVIKTDDAVAA